MPTRLKFTLHGVQSQNPFVHAQALQGLVYSWIKAVDPNRSQTLHDSASSKPLSISPLAVVSDNLSAFYVTCLDDALACTVCKGADCHGNSIHLKAPSEVKTFTLDSNIEFVDESSWTKIEYESLAAYAWRIHLLSPTVCRKKGRLLPLPDPVNYFSSWYFRWESFAPKSLEAPTLLDFVKDHIDVIGFSGETVKIPVNENQEAFPGFTGTVEFAVRKSKLVDSTLLKKLDCLVSLGDFSGTGAQTMRGMGQTRTERLKSH